MTRKIVKYSILAIAIHLTAFLPPKRSPFFNSLIHSDLIISWQD
ncbi:MAG TPA: hypothetical protein V6C71_01720 [Coleofasciculaceae cyanobacterium]